MIETPAPTLIHPRHSSLAIPYCHAIYHAHCNFRPMAFFARRKRTESSRCTSSAFFQSVMPFIRYLNRRYRKLAAVFLSALGSTFLTYAEILLFWFGLLHFSAQNLGLKFYIDMHYFLLLIAWIASGDCWPIFEGEHKLDLRTTQNSQLMGRSATNDSAITARTITLSKGINTFLAGVIFLLTVITYMVIMRYTTTLSNEIILPSRFLEKNIAAVLSTTWPEHIIDSPNETFPPESPWVLFLIGSFRWTSKPIIEALGFLDIGLRSQPRNSDSQPKDSDSQSENSDSQSENSDSQSRNSFIVVKVFSPVMKNLVQIAIWNWFSLWLVLIMIVNTIIYNVVSKSFTRESKIRLVLIGVYALANFGHQFYIAKLLYRNFNSVIFQTCWTLICQQFIFLTYDDFLTEFHQMKSRGDDRGNTTVWNTFNLELLGRTEHSDTYQAQVDAFDHTAVNYVVLPDDKRWTCHLNVQDKTKSKFDKFTKPLREAEIKAYEKATESALEKALVNVAVLLGICLATALAPWTSLQTTNAIVAQLGLYALLLSISTGLFGFG